MIQFATLGHDLRVSRDCCVSISHIIRNMLGELPEETDRRLGQRNAAGVLNPGIGLDRLMLRRAKLKTS